MKSISTRIKLPMSIGTCIPLLTKYSKNRINTLKEWITKLSHQHWKSQKEVLKLDWIKENIDVECDDHLKNIDDIGFRMINMYSKDWLADYKPLTDLIANLNLKFEDKSWVEYAERSFENDWLIINVKACCYRNEFGSHYAHEIEYKYTDKFKSKIISHYKNEDLKVFENEKGVFVTL